MSRPVLVCFAVSQEAGPFLRTIRGRTDVEVVITGMGARNAEATVREALARIQPSRVWTCGFAGALHPDLQIGDVICAREFHVPRARPVELTCETRVAVTVAEKSALRSRTNADAVEMESGVIQRVCREAGVECVTLRVISDTAHEDLPLDFNSLMTLEQKLSPAKLAWAILKTPRNIPALMRLGRNSAIAAQRLSEVLATAISTR